MSSRTGDAGRHLERFLQDLQRYMPLLEAEARHIKELQRETDSKLLRDVQDENKRLTKENEELRKNVRALQETRQIEKEEKEKTERDEKTNMHAEMSREIERLTHQCEETEALVNEKFKDELNLLVVEKRSLEELCDEQKLQITSLEKKVCDSERKEQDSQHLENKYKKLRKKLEETEKELEGTKLRLSEMMGHQLSDRNPNIADLSDQTRPTKLGEMFSSLYDDEYTNAFEEIDRYSKDNKGTCEKLLELLMDAYTFCEKRADDQLKALKRECLAQNQMSTSFEHKSLVDYTLKEMKDIRKKNANKSVEGVYKAFEKHMTDIKGSSIFRHPHAYAKTIEYVKTCVKLCWLMAVHDPPLVFGPLPHKYDTFDANLYRGYTKSGTLIDFTVWPVLYLHENGPVLSKGVVEPFKESRTDNRDEFRSHEVGDLGRYFDTELRQSTRDRDIDIGMPSRQVSSADIYTYDRQVDNLFDTGGRHRGDYSTTYLSETDSSLSGLNLRGTRHTSASYQQDILPTTYNRHLCASSRPHAQRTAWRY